MNRGRTRIQLLALALFALTVQPLFAQDFPSKPIRLVVPFAPGGSTDIIARSVGQKMAERLGQPVLTDNKPGASTTIGTEFVARSPADGYTMLLVPVPFVTAQYTFAKLGYDSRRDFAAVSQLINIPLVIAVNPARVEARTLGAFVAAMKAQPGKFSMGSPGEGSHSHLAFELFRMQTGVDALHVPYKGSGPVITDLLGGQIDFATAALPSVQGHIGTGKLRAIGAYPAQRTPAAPNVPTFSEQGLANFEVEAWFGVLGPKGMGAAAVKKVHDALVAAFADPAVREAMAKQGNTIRVGSTEQAQAAFRAELAKYAALVKKVGLEPQ